MKKTLFGAQRKGFYTFPGVSFCNNSGSNVKLILYIDIQVLNFCPSFYL